MAMRFAISSVLLQDVKMGVAEGSDMTYYQEPIT
jgi:hypothetical protein